QVDHHVGALADATGPERPRGGREEEPRDEEDEVRRERRPEKLKEVGVHGSPFPLCAPLSGSLPARSRLRAPAARPARPRPRARRQRRWPGPLPGSPAPSGPGTRDTGPAAALRTAPAAPRRLAAPPGGHACW